MDTGQWTLDSGSPNYSSIIRVLHICFAGDLRQLSQQRDHVFSQQIVDCRLVAVCVVTTPFWYRVYNCFACPRSHHPLARFCISHCRDYEKLPRTWFCLYDKSMTQRIYIIREQKGPPPPHRHKLRHLFPVCITVLWVLGSYTDRQVSTVLLYTYSRQSSYSDRGKASPFDDEGGAFCSLRIYSLAWPVWPDPNWADFQSSSQAVDIISIQ